MSGLAIVLREREDATSCALRVFGSGLEVLYRMNSGFKTLRGSYIDIANRELGQLTLRQVRGALQRKLT